MDKEPPPLRPPLLGGPPGWDAHGCLICVFQSRRPVLHAENDTPLQNLRPGRSAKSQEHIPRQSRACCPKGLKIPFSHSNKRKVPWARTQVTRGAKSQKVKVKTDPSLAGRLSFPLVLISRQL